ncbi:MAG: L,D-transpeptidase family protein [Bacteroidota bacterium]|nr:L,D-transpeptidase family protein [Bacteroidota bacterium]
MKRSIVICHLILCTLALACNETSSQNNVKTDTTITTQTSFNNLFTDSSTINNFIESHPAFSEFKDQYFNFYKARNYEYAWFDTSGLAEQAHHFINLVNNTIDNLQDSSLYDASTYRLYNASAEGNHKSKKEMIQTELSLTGLFFTYAAKVYKGSNINTAELGWFIPRKKVDVAALLDSTLKSKNADALNFPLLHPQYKKLQDALAVYYNIQKQNIVWDSIPLPSKPLKEGHEYTAIPEIKYRLKLLGDYDSQDSSSYFDSLLLIATKRFQKRTGLSADGVIGAKMISELNITPEQRIRQLLVNMERIRWMPPQEDSNYVLVNIPEYKMHVFDSGKQVFDMNVIVGKSSTGTVIFNGNLKYIVFSPYWNVPVSIVQKELLPVIKRNPNYLAKNNMEITGYSGGLPIIRQKPGESNALGLVKFLFPNNYSIYLHDTPNKELFSSPERGFSHGCIRISDARKFAQYLLRYDTVTWKPQAIDSCMHLSREKWVTLAKTLPVYIVYFTAWVDKDGILNFRKDIYKHDEKMINKLFVKK